MLKDSVNCLVPNSLKKPISGAPNGSLSGLTFVAKDLFNVVGHRTSNGSPDFFEHTEISSKNATAINQLLEAGATLIGMTICDEFFYSLTGANAHYGTPINSKAPKRLPGGSSSGSAAAVAAGIVDFSLGSDTGGSVRIPSSFCGIWGMRPTFGRVSTEGVRPMAPSFDTVGWFSSTPELMAKIAKHLLEGNSDNSPITKTLFANDAISRSDQDIQTAFNNWADGLAIRNNSVTIALDGLDHWWEVFRVIQAGEVKKTNLPWVRAHNASLGPGIRERFEIAENITDLELKAAREQRNKVKREIDKFLTPGTILILPTAPCIAPLLTSDENTLGKFRSDAMALTCIAGLAGLPQISIPALQITGCPVGVSLIGTAGSDELLIEKAISLDLKASS